MKRLLLLAIIGSAIVAPSAQAPVQAGLDAAIASIDATIAADFAKDGVGGLSMGVVSGKELIWSKHYGYADAEAKRVADNDTTYRVGSITKQFTALALLQLVEKNQMRLTDPLEKYIPEVKQVKSPPAGTPPITILQVATMTSGLAREPDCDNHSVGSDAEWQKIVLRCLPQTSYVNEPGTTYLYSNIGYATLGLAVERAGRQPFIDLVRDRILVPLGMSRSAMEASTTVRANLAHGYQRSEAGGTPSRAAADRALDGRGYRVPNGGLLSTVNDLAKFVAWKVGDGPSGILKKEAQEANYSRAFFYGPGMYTGYGVGFQIQWRGPVLMLGHGGSTDGYHSSLLVHRPTHLGVIVLRNCDNCPVDAAPVAARALAQLVTAKAKQNQGSLPPPEPQKEEDSLVRRLAGGARADLGAPLATVARSGADAHQPRRPNQSLAGVRVVKTYTAERREDLVFTKGALRLFRNIAKSMLEIWYWMDLNRPTHTREIKRLEIQVAKLVDRIGRP